MYAELSPAAAEDTMIKPDGFVAMESMGPVQEYVAKACPAIRVVTVKNTDFIVMFFMYFLVAMHFGAQSYKMGFQRSPAIPVLTSV
jgi:hypothetical protein